MYELAYVAKAAIICITDLIERKIDFDMLLPLLHCLTNWWLKVLAT